MTEQPSNLVAQPPTSDSSVGAHGNAPGYTRHIVIIGGGISGLSAAWYLQQQNPAVRCTVLESFERWGGKIHTDQMDDFVVEAGPDSFLTRKPWAVNLAYELGLSDRLIPTNDRMKTTYILHRGKPVRLPDGVLMIVPTKFLPFALTPLISLSGKLRMALDWLIPAKRDNDDETLSEFVRRRLGSEALDKIAEPLMSGIYNAEADKQSMLATFPTFRQLEREHGSLIRGMLASRRQSAKTPPAPMFMSLKGGTQELVTALVSRLNGDLRLNTQVTKIEQTSQNRYRVITGSGDILQADAIVFTTPAYVTADLLQGLAPAAAEKLASIRHVSTGTISLAFKASDIQNPLHGYGLVVPKSEQRPINAITISSAKFSHRAPDNHVLLRVFFGGSRSPETMHHDDEKLLSVVREELCDILGIDAPPLFHRIYRWHRANPQYDVHHLKRVDAIEASLPDGIFVTGSAFRGVGIPDCIDQAQQTVSRLLAHLTEPALQEFKAAL